MIRTLGLVPALALAVACPDCNETPTEDAGPGGPGDVAAAAKELCIAVSLGNNNVFFAALHGLTRCSVEEDWPEVDAETLQAIEDSCEEGNELYDMFITAFYGDRVVIDVDRSLACVEKGRGVRGGVSPYEYNNGGADGFGDLFEDADCDGAATALLGDGDECVQSWDCPEELPCQASPPDNPTLRCLALAADGDRCGGARFCDAGLSCVDEVCVGPIAQGADCVTGNEGGLRPCVEGAYCDGAASGVCQPKKPANATCATATECEDGLGCPSDTLVCTAAPPAVAEGQPCDPAADACESYCSVCRADRAGGETACRDRAAQGSYCEVTNDCRTGLECDETNSECVPEAPEQLPALGQECGVNDAPFDCEEGSCVFNVCTAGVAGDVCETSFPACDVGLVCEADDVEPDRGACVAEPAIGDACIGGQCGAGAWCNPDGNCAAQREPGASCGEGNECISGTCLSSSNTCATSGPSCYTAKATFLNMLTLAFLLPLFARLRRRRRR
jgi:hypothetical protein